MLHHLKKQFVLQVRLSEVLRESGNLSCSVGSYQMVDSLVADVSSTLVSHIPWVYYYVIRLSFLLGYVSLIRPHNLLNSFVSLFSQ